MEPALHLASSSPRRAELLTALGFQFTQQGVDVDETRLDGEAPEAMVSRLAVAKALACDRDAVIIGADTVVVQGDAVFGKPQTAAEAVSMLEALSDAVHQVMTGVAVRRGEHVHTAVSVTDVRFRSIDADEARRYWNTGEPADKAGAYAVQGLGGIFVASINGSYSGVVGLPVFETSQLLRNVGIGVLGN